MNHPDMGQIRQLNSVTNMFNGSQTSLMGATDGTICLMGATSGTNMSNYATVGQIAES